MSDIKGSSVPLRRFEGKVLLVVNVASKCGLTPQYEGLQKLYERYREKGLEILAFPANNFLWQEPGANEQIEEFCSAKFGVSFPLFSKISVKGRDIHPLYSFLTAKDTNPLFAGSIGWNFAKFLVDRTGRVIARFDPRTEPLAPPIVSAVETTLGD